MVDLPRAALVDEGVVLAEVKVGNGVQQLLLGGNALLRQQIHDLLHRVTLGNGHQYQPLLLSPRCLRIVHAPHQTAVVHGGVQLVCARVDVLFGAGNDLKEHEEAPQLDKAGLFQLVGNGKYTVAFLNGHRAGLVALVQSAQVVCQKPADARQQHGAKHHSRHIGRPVEFLFPALLFRRRLRCGVYFAHDPPAHRFGVPTLRIIPLLFIHGHISFLHFFCNMSQTSSIFRSRHIQYCTNR